MSSLWCIFFKFLITKQEDFCTLPLYIAKGNKQYEIIKALAFEENGGGEDIANRAFNENDSDEEMQHALDWTAPLLRHSGPDTYATRMNECTKAVERQEKHKAGHATEVPQMKRVLTARLLKRVGKDNRC